MTVGFPSLHLEFGCEMSHGSPRISYNQQRAHIPSPLTFFLFYGPAQEVTPSLCRKFIYALPQFLGK